MQTRTTCEKCGGKLQMTVVRETYFTLEDGVWKFNDSDEVELRVYCENDHPVSDDDATQLVELVRTLT